MAEFESWRSYWAFSRETARERRYVRTPAGESFINAVRESVSSRVQTVPEGYVAWRAQLGHDWRLDDTLDDYVPVPWPATRMKPLSDRASEGRANPKGIPCLYVATTKETAMSEVRPWIGSLVSVARVTTTAALKVVNCTVNYNGNPLYLQEPSFEERAAAVWSHIDRAFSEPTTRTDDTAEYAATQVLAELFKSLGYDGVAFKSAFGEDGYNIALFDLSMATVTDIGLFKVKGATFSFAQEDTFYHLLLKD